MNYRPITDTWILARAKLKGGVKYYGAYPGGFLERARALLGVSIDDPVLHVCAGMVRAYPYKHGFGPNDATLDLDPDLHPDYLQDAREKLPGLWPAILIDPPYTVADADKYEPGMWRLPLPNELLARACDAVRVGGRIGMLHYILPSPGKLPLRFVALVSVYVGYNNRVRCFSVFEKKEAAK